MAVGTTIKYAEIDDLYLDPLNPRLGRNITSDKLSQEKIMELMRDWTLDELAVSFLESGYWPHEALIVINEELYGKPRLVVVEGNRRLAALMFLRDAIAGKPASRRWTEIARIDHVPPSLFERVPYILVDSRKDIESFLGFRHVTGIKEWKPAEKAEYIARLIEDSGKTYEEVMRSIGSKTPTVRQNYISYRLLLQMEDHENISIEQVEDKFSVLYLSLRTEGAQKYLNIDIKAEPGGARRPVPDDKLDALAKFALWLFGDDRHPPLFTDSRRVDDFGEILESPEAVAYLERSERPNFEVAYRIAGGDEKDIVRLVQRAADNIEFALMRVHLYTKSEELRKAIERFGKDSLQILRIFPDIREDLTRDHQ